MKIQLIDDHGILLEEITEIEQYHLGGPAGRIDLWIQIRTAIETAQAVETDNELAQGALEFVPGKFGPVKRGGAA